MTEDAMVGWYHSFNGHESEQIREIAKDREAWREAVHEGCKESDTTELLSTAQHNLSLFCYA